MLNPIILTSCVIFPFFLSNLRIIDNSLCWYYTENKWWYSSIVDKLLSSDLFIGFSICAAHTFHGLYDEHIDSRRRQASPASPAECRQTISFCWRLDAHCRLFKVCPAQASHLVMQHAKPVTTAGSISLWAHSSHLPPHTHGCPSVFSSLCSSRSNYDYSAVWHMLLRRHSRGVGGPDDTRSHWMRHWVMYYIVCVCVSLFVCWSKILASAIIPQLPHTGAGAPQDAVYIIWNVSSAL